MWHTILSPSVAQKLNSNLQRGLNEEEAKKRLEQYGKNKLEEGEKESYLKKFINQFNDFMILILIGAAVISFITAFMEHNSDYIDSIIIVVIVVFNAILGVVQEAKAEKSLEALKEMSAPTAKVKRNGKIVLVPGENVVPGDIIILETGNYVPADSRLIKSYNLKIEEAALTGETVPVLKNEKLKLAEDIPTGDMINMAFATTVVTAGHGEAVVVATGMETNVGKIAKMIINNESKETPLQRKLGAVGKTLGIGALMICALIFVIGIIKRISIYEMFMTSIGLAVAAIPEGLPAIITIMLSIGVTKMAKKRTIIRKLPAVETLGSSSVICSDKTGTLTQNKMTVTEVSWRRAEGGNRKVKN